MNNLEKIKKFYLENYNFQRRKVIRVSGTNGKGTTSHILLYLLMLKNKKVGLFSSPHVFKKEERIKVNNNNIPKNIWKEINDKFENISFYNELNFFEKSFLICCEYFKNFVDLDIMIFESGIGGVFDTTSCLSTNINIVSSISKDHLDFFDDSYDILILNKIKTIKSAKYNFVCLDIPYIAKKKILKKYRNKNIIFSNIYIDKEIQNFELANKVFHLLYPNTPVSKEQTLKMYKNKTGLLGRMECLDKKRNIFFDVAHNESSISNIIKKGEFMNYFIYSNINKSIKIINSEYINHTIFHENDIPTISLKEIPNNSLIMGSFLIRKNVK